MWKLCLKSKYKGKTTFLVTMPLQEAEQESKIITFRDGNESFTKTVIKDCLFTRFEYSHDNSAVYLHSEKLSTQGVFSFCSNLSNESRWQLTNYDDVLAFFDTKLYVPINQIFEGYKLL